MKSTEIKKSTQNPSISPQSTELLSENETTNDKTKKTSPMSNVQLDDVELKKETSDLYLNNKMKIKKWKQPMKKNPHKNQILY